MTTIETPQQIRDRARPVAYVTSAREAAAYLGCSESAVRRECRLLGVQRIAGRTVAGYVVWPRAKAGLNGCIDLAMSFSRGR